MPRDHITNPWSLGGVWPGPSLQHHQLYLQTLPDGDGVDRLICCMRWWAGVIRLAVHHGVYNTSSQSTWINKSISSGKKYYTRHGAAWCSRFLSSVEMSWSSNKLQGLVCTTVFICGAMSPGTVQSAKGIRINMTE